MSKKDFFDWQIERVDPKMTPWFGKKSVIEHQLRYQLAVKLVRNKIAIDLGCGVGYGTLLLAKGGARKVYGIDISFNAISQAKNRYYHKNIAYEVKDAMNTKLPSHIADIVVAFEIIEHVKNHKKFLGEVARLLKPNGTLILSTPNNEASFGDNPYHLKEFTLQELISILSSFTRLQMYGQHKVDRRVIICYKAIGSFIKVPFLRMLLRFRPWEKTTIEPIQSSSNYAYLYYIVQCQKSTEKE